MRSEEEGGEPAAQCTSEGAWRGTRGWQEGPGGRPELLHTLNSHLGFTVMMNHTMHSVSLFF